MFKAIKDLMKKPIKFNVSVQNMEESTGKGFIELNKNNTKFNQHITLGQTQSGTKHTKKLMIVKKAMNGDSFIVIDNPYSEIEDLAKKLGVDYKVSEEYGDTRIVFNPNSNIEENININSRFFKGFNKVLVVGNLGSFAYPVFRWVIWNTNEHSNRYVWVDEHGNDDFIQKQKKHNIDVVYDDRFRFEMTNRYDGIFLNGLDRPFFLEKTFKLEQPVVLRTGVDDIEGYSLNGLKSIFDLIIVANPKNDEKGKREITRLLNSHEEIEKFEEISEVILIYKDNIKHTEVVFPKDFPFSRWDRDNSTQLILEEDNFHLTRRV
ncbi:MAG: hypothetical protein MJA82_06230 [Clostridia bacterium]|nr:hypothetical protein [Clostridia bacterium]